MTPADEDYAERLAIVLEGGDVTEARAREIAALSRGCAVRPATGLARASGQPSERTPHRGAQAAQGGKR